jgi:hypothetical protein
VLKNERDRGLITDLELQPRYPLYVCGIDTTDLQANPPIKVCTYVADFRYRRGGVSIIEDVKGLRLPLYKLKAKMLLAQYGIAILET